MLILVAIAGFSLGIISMWALRFYVRRRHLKLAQNDGQDLIENAELNSEDAFRELKARLDADADEMRRASEEKLSSRLQKLESWKEEIDEKEEKLNENLKVQKSQLNRRQQQVDSYNKKVQNRETNYRRLRDDRNKKHSDFVAALGKKADIPQEDLLKELTTKLLQQSNLTTSKWLQEHEEEFYQDSERRAKRLLSTAISRFARPYCPERGAGYLNFASTGIQDKILGKENENLALIEKTCGVDLISDRQNLSLSVSGFDPVRRELARASIEKLMHQKVVTSEVIQRVTEKTKRVLFRKVRQDGQKLAKEMRLKGLNQNIIDMMGALRYRYSFTQNQYFHCAEVGHLCGLLASEVNESLGDARRAGMLHDIGKAMDHSRDGGHAVLGADFIKNNDEAPHIVHAVRAHHYDEAPTTNLAHLVIAADAISGARPGARRSTANTYMQKMEDLHEIAKSFEGVTDTHILSAGREVRVSVDGQKTNDWKALELSQKIARKIEDECNYPGQIKVTVVREIQAVEFAR